MSVIGSCFPYSSALEETPANPGIHMKSAMLQGFKVWRMTHETNAKKKSRTKLHRIGLTLRILSSFTKKNTSKQDSPRDPCCCLASDPQKRKNTIPQLHLPAGSKPIDMIFSCESTHPLGFAKPTHGRSREKWGASGCQMDFSGV